MGLKIGTTVGPLFDNSRNQGFWFSPRFSLRVINSASHRSNVQASSFTNLAAAVIEIHKTRV
jgi:hypothetical protein